MSLSESSGAAVTALSAPTLPSIPVFEPFDSTSELWLDFYDRFLIFADAHNVKDEQKTQIFLTNHSKHFYRFLGNLAKQQNPPMKVNDLTMVEIATFMKASMSPNNWLEINVSNFLVICAGSQMKHVKSLWHAFAKMLSIVILHPTKTFKMKLSDLALFAL